MGKKLRFFITFYHILTFWWPELNRPMHMQPNQMAKCWRVFISELCTVLNVLSIFIFSIACESYVIFYCQTHVCCFFVCWVGHVAIVNNDAFHKQHSDKRTDARQQMTAANAIIYLYFCSIFCYLPTLLTNCLSFFLYLQSLQSQVALSLRRSSYFIYFHFSHCALKADFSISFIFLSCFPFLCRR